MGPEGARHRVRRGGHKGFALSVAPSWPQAPMTPRPRRIRWTVTMPFCSRISENSLSCPASGVSNGMPAMGFQAMRLTCAFRGCIQSASSSASLSRAFTLPRSTTSSVMRSRVFLWYSRRAVLSSARGQVLLTGMSRLRSSGFADVRETASRTTGPAFARSRMPGTMPLVDMVILRIDIPIPSGCESMATAFRMVSRFRRGSPIPMNTTFEMKPRMSRR